MIVTTQKARQIWALGGGKGGIGKSMVVGGMGIHIAQLGKKVILADTDLGGANLHTCLGLPLPKVTLDDFIKRRVEKLEDVVCETNCDNLGLISGAQEFLAAANPKHAQKIRLLKKLQSLDIDYLILDLGSGTSFNILDFFLISDNGIIMMVPEPTSVENTYRFLKGAFYRRLRRVTIYREIRELIELALDQKNIRGIKTPRDLVEEIERMDKKLGRILSEEAFKFRPKLIINQVRMDKDIELGFSVKNICSQYLGIQLDYLGYIYYDDCVWQSVRKKKHPILEYPDSKASVGIKMVANNLLQNQQFRL
ncbi:MAG: P-loop NTPase [Deltaproteobacteria bacterium]|nr:MAG: P-loop NTPase [Deltaproteobacteria bacterium]